ncbi:MAG: hypothetical protein ABR517_12370 [Thermoanaerobaculia bacterium]
MAEIHVEKKPRSGWIWVWVLLLVLLIAVLAWLYWPDASRTERDATTTVPATGTDPTTVDSIPLPDAPAQVPQETEATLSSIRATPRQWIGREFSGVVTVAQPGPTDAAIPAERGFWIEQEGQRLFVLIGDDSGTEAAAITPGQQVRIRGAVRDAAFIPQLPGEPLDVELDELIRTEPAFLVVNQNSIELVPSGP